MSSTALPMWAEIAIAALLLCGAIIALLGSIGLLRLPSFFERVHAPAMISTLGCWCMVGAAVLYFSLRSEPPALHILLIALFMAITVPITTIFLMRAGLFRARQARHKGVPPSLSRILPAPTSQDAPK